MLDFSLMLWVKLPVNRIQTQSNKFAMGLENKATGDSKLNDNPDRYVSTDQLFTSSQEQSS